MHRPMWKEDIQTAFFKCTNWQLEETLDPDSCPYHYYCNSSYPGDYTPTIDLLVLVFTAASFSAAIVFMVLDMAGGCRHWPERIKQSRRYLLPSGPIFFPVTILIMAKGYRIDTLFPMKSTGPAILQLIRISAIAFEDEAISDLKYVFLESSTVSGILHAALYLDSIVLPFYTGLDALALSTPSGECASCVCRDRALTVGGVVVVFRGWSITTAAVVGSLCLKIACRVWRESGRKAAVVRAALENLSWVLMAAESFYLVMVPHQKRMWTRDACFAGVFVLMCLQLARKACGWINRSPQMGSATVQKGDCSCSWLYQMYIKTIYIKANTKWNFCWRSN